MTTDTANPLAEAAVLGACMADPDAVVFVAPVVDPDAFTVPVHRWVAEAVWACFREPQPPTLAAVVDRLTVAHRWSERPQAGHVCFADLEGLVNAATDADVQHVVSNARLVAEAAFRRRGNVLVSKAAELFTNPELTPQELQQGVLRYVGAAFETSAQRDASLGAIGAEERRRIDTMADLPGVPCGLRWLDDITGGFLPAENWVIAAPYKMRKTTLVLNMVLSAAQAGAPVVVFTNGDSSRDATYRKLLAMVMNRAMLGRPEYASAVSGKTLQYRLSNTAYAALRDECAATLEQLPIRLYDGRDLIGNLSEAARLLRRDAAMHGTQVYVYDYAQAIANGKDDYERTTQFAQWMQQLSGELGLTGIAISQVSEDQIRNSGDGYSPGAKGGGALPAMANVFLVVKYKEPVMTVELKLARDSAMGQSVQHKLQPASGLILDGHLVIGK